MKKQSRQSDIEALAKVVAAVELLEPPQQIWVLQTAASRFSLTTNQLQQPGAKSKSDEITAALGSGDGEASPKEFLNAKNPRTQVQRIACLAYFLSKRRRTPRFNTRQLADLNSEAGWHGFSSPSVCVENASKAKLLSLAGGGNKQLTSLGKALVDALPNQEFVKEIMSATGRRKGRPPLKMR